VPDDPFGMILWENVGYLIDDERRAALFAEFTERVGLCADDIAAARDTVLLDIARCAGMRPEERVAKRRRIAQITTARAGGDLNAALATLTPAKAAALLRAYPAIGEPGADKIMLFAGLDVRPAVDSNGVRAMLRLGLCREGKSYGASYRAATAALRTHGKATRAWFTDTYRALKAHGRAVCKRTEPLCVACALSVTCPRTKFKGSY